MRISLSALVSLSALALAACNNAGNSNSSLTAVPSQPSYTPAAVTAPISNTAGAVAATLRSAPANLSEAVTDLAATPRSSGNVKPITIPVSDDNSFTMAAEKASAHCSKFGMKPGAPFMRNGGAALEYNCQ